MQICSDRKPEKRNQLHDNLVKIIKGHCKDHFLGSLVSDDHNGEFLIVDSQ